MDMNEEESPILSLSEGRELLKGTELENLSDEELQEALETIRTFCEMCFEHYLNSVAKGKVIPLNLSKEDDEQRAEAA